ncbi:MAG: carbonic anhydrase [Leptolyngbyaceae bacterium]|nr:carbonic anhydrase [Leptolyngbyaceae bacterium]
MRKLITGLREFKAEYVSAHRDLLEQLSHGQKPRVLFITCSDSRISPNLMTHADLGELFVIRNAGNIIPPFGAANGGEGASVEYAIHALGIEQVVVCGHSHCGAMKGLLKLSKLEEDMPLVYDWLKHAEATRRLLKENYGEYSGEELLEIAIAENVLTQIENLRTYPVVRSKLHQGKLRIYGWIYEIETGEVLAYNPDTNAFVPPQSQLDYSKQGSIDGFSVTSNGPTAIDIPTLHQPAAVSATPSHPQGTPPDMDGLNSIPWLSPEQAARIYRGSAPK